MHFFRRFIILLLISITLLTGCAEKTDLFAYIRGPAQFELSFPSVSGDTDAVTCTCIREIAPDDTVNITLTVIAPDRLKGFTVEIRDGSTTCGTDDMRIPLSADAAQGLTDLLTTLTEEGTPRKSPDGTHTIITTPTGTVTLDETLNPTEIETNGRRAKVKWNAE